MSTQNAGEAQRYIVVINHEGQYSIWPSGREIPRGWDDVGRAGSREDCLAYIEEAWTDMRPLSLRRKMDTPVEPGAGEGQAVTSRSEP
jgi:MbtH protein